MTNHVIMHYHRYDFIAVSDLDIAQYGYVQAGLNQIINKVTLKSRNNSILN